jgi:hypothetical protein
MENATMKDQSDHGRGASKLDFVADLPDSPLGRRQRERATGTLACLEVDREIERRLGVKRRPQGVAVHWTRRHAGELLTRDDVLHFLNMLGHQLELLLSAGLFPKPKTFDGSERFFLSAVLSWSSKRRAA